LLEEGLTTGCFGGLNTAQEMHQLRGVGEELGGCPRCLWSGMLWAMP